MQQKKLYRLSFDKRKMMLNLTKSSSRGNPIENEVPPVHEEKPQNTGNEIENGASGCNDTKSKSGDKETKDKDERETTHPNLDDNKGIFCENENENIDSTICRNPNALRTQTSSKNVENIESDDKVSENDSTAEGYTNASETDSSQDQIMSNDAGSEQENYTSTTVSPESSNDKEGVNSSLQTDLTKSAYALEQSRLEDLLKQGKTESFKEQEDVLTARTGLLAIKDFPTATVQDTNGKIPPLPLDDDVKEGGDTSRQKLQPKVDVPGLNFSCSKDQPQWPLTQKDDLSPKDEPPGPHPLMSDLGCTDQSPCHTDEPPGSRPNDPSFKGRPPDLHPPMDGPGHHSDERQEPQPLIHDSGFKDWPPDLRPPFHDPGVKDQPFDLGPPMNDPDLNHKPTWPRQSMEYNPSHIDQPPGLEHKPSWPQPDPCQNNQNPHGHFTGQNNQNQKSLSETQRFCCQDQTPAISLPNYEANDHEETPCQGPVHYEEAVMVNDLLLEHDREDHPVPVDQMPPEDHMLNGSFHSLHEDNQQIPVDNPYMEYGISPNVIPEPSPIIDLNDHERLDLTHLILQQDQQFLQRGREQRLHDDELQRRLRRRNEDFNGITLREHVNRLEQLRAGRTVYASRVSHGLRSGTIDENYHLDGNMMCLVCRNRPVGTRLHPCGHLVYCRMCVRSQPSCRQCGEVVEDNIGV